MRDVGFKRGKFNKKIRAFPRICCHISSGNKARAPTNARPNPALPHTDGRGRADKKPTYRRIATGDEREKKRREKPPNRRPPAKTTLAAFTSIQPAADGRTLFVQKAPNALSRTRLRNEPRCDACVETGLGSGATPHGSRTTSHGSTSRRPAFLPAKRGNRAYIALNINPFKP